MKSICNSDCCEKCQLLGSLCEGCTKTNGHPCGGSCIAADCIKEHGMTAFEDLKKELINEVNSIGISDLHIDEFYLLMGSFVNLEYTLSNGEKFKLLSDNKVYLGNQIEQTNSERCYGLVADEKYLLICEYGANGANPEIVLYKKR